MPIYEYECPACDCVVEILVRRPYAEARSEHDVQFEDENQCPSCGKKELHRVVSAPAAPATSSKKSLPVAPAGEGCGAPRCCGGGCDF